MKTYQIQKKFYKVLAHPTRLAILDILRDGEQCVCHMEAVLKLRQAHISQHLMVLREAGLVSDRRDGWNIYYRVVKPEIYPVVDAMNTFSGKPSVNPYAARIASAKRDCPCPKCSPDAASPRQEELIISIENLKAPD